MMNYNKNIHKSNAAICLLFFYGCFWFSCNRSSDSNVDASEYFQQFILEDQGALDDASFQFTTYSSDINGDSTDDFIIITTYMDSYFGYVFDGKTRKAIPQSGWENFVSKPGNQMSIEFMDITCDKSDEIIMHSIYGHRNRNVRVDVLKVIDDSLRNVFSQSLTYQNGHDGNIQFQKFRSEPCSNELSLLNANDSIPLHIKNRIAFIQNFEIVGMEKDSINYLFRDNQFK